jgi:preprotein translocase subunit SecG
MKAVRLLLVYAGLLLLLAIAATVAIQSPQWALVALACAAGQAVLVLFGLAELGSHPALVRLFALAAGFWLVLMFALPLADLLTRAG